MVRRDLGREARPHLKFRDRGVTPKPQRVEGSNACEDFVIGTVVAALVAALMVAYYCYKRTKGIP
jgi:hypothetical protein